MNPGILLHFFIKLTIGLYPKPAQSFGRTSVHVYGTTGRYKLDDRTLHRYRWENLKLYYYHRDIKYIEWF
jgi:hypothetical protein